jgi:integrase/recombinase XerD
MPTTWTAQKIHFLTQPELRACFRVMTRKRDRALFLLAYRHGLRASEVGLLHVDDLYLRERKSPSPSLFVSQRGTPISRRQLDTLMKHYGELADIPVSKRHFHVLKHSIATHLLDAGADLRFVQDWVGHASIKNTVIYAQLTSRRRDAEARKVFTSPYVV